MLTSAELTNIEPSSAMAPLTQGAIRRVLETCQQLVRERQQIVTILNGLPPNVHHLRKALNDLLEGRRLKLKRVS